MIDDYEAIANMTDAEAAEELEKVRLMLTGGRANGKTRLSMSYNVALQKAIIALKSTTYCMAAAAGAGYEVGRESKNVAYLCDGKKCPEEKASCKKGGPCHHTTDINHAINFGRMKCGENEKYYEFEHKFGGRE